MTWELQPALVLVAGRPGDGKSALSAAMLTLGKFELLKSDRVRSEITNGRRTYSTEESARVHQELLWRAGKHLSDGKASIVDATLAVYDHRLAFLDLATQLAVPSMYIRVCATNEQRVKALMDQRLAEGTDDSEAGYAIRLKITQNYDHHYGFPYYFVRNDGGLDDLHKTAVTLMERLQIDCQNYRRPARTCMTPTAIPKVP